MAHPAGADGARRDAVMAYAVAAAGCVGVASLAAMTDLPRAALLRAGLCFSMIALLAWALRGDAARTKAAALVGASLLAVVSYANFGSFHGRGFVHHWEQFHYALGAKYFPELGYDGLYVASIGAQADQSGTGHMQTWTRDLRDYRVVHTRTLVPHMQAVHARFTPERWQSFARDNAFFVENNGFEHLGRVRRDHGMNGSPAWLFVARALSGSLPFDVSTLTLLALADVVLLALAYAAVFRTFGLAIGASSLVLFGVAYAGAFDFVGGSFLRFDWLAALLLAACAMERGRFGLAGAALGYAAMVRIFPLLLLLGPAVVAVRALYCGERPRWALRFVAGFAAAAILLVAAGSTTGRGIAAWSEFAGTLRMHAGTFLTNNVGLENLLVYDRAIVERRDVDWSLPEPWIAVQERVDERREAMSIPLLALRAVWLALLILACWRACPTEALVAGMVGVFGLVTVTSYYWLVVVLVPFARRPHLVSGVLLLDAIAWGVDGFVPGFEGRFGLFSLGLAVLFLAWMLPAAIGTLRGAPATRRRAVEAGAAA